MNIKKTLLILAAAVCAATTGLVLKYNADQVEADKASLEARKDAPIHVGKAIAARGSIPAVVSAVGSASAQAVAIVKPRVDGLLLRFLAAEGSQVRQGQAIAQLDPSGFEAALSQALGALARDQAQLDGARVDLARLERLLAKEAVAKQQVDAQSALVKQFSGLAMADKAAAKTAQLNLSWTTVRAPISGTLGIRSADPGNAVRSTDGTGIATIVGSDSMGAIFSIPADAARLVGPGSVVLAHARSGGPLLARGKIAAVDNQIDSATGTLRARAVFPAQESRLISNEFLQIKVLGRETAGVVVPSSCIALGSSGALAWSVDPSTMRAKSIPIKILAQNDDSAVVEGVGAGTALASDSLDKLRDGARVVFTDASPTSLTPANPHGVKDGASRPATKGPST